MISLAEYFLPFAGSFLPFCGCFPMADRRVISVCASLILSGVLIMVRFIVWLVKILEDRCFYLESLSVIVAVCAFVKRWMCSLFVFLIIIMAPFSIGF